MFSPDGGVSNGRISWFLVESAVLVDGISTTLCHVAVSWPAVLWTGDVAARLFKEKKEENIGIIRSE